MVVAVVTWLGLRSWRSSWFVGLRSAAVAMATWLLAGLLLSGSTRLDDNSGGTSLCIVA